MDPTGTRAETPGLSSSGRIDHDGKYRHRVRHGCCTLTERPVRTLVGVDDAAIEHFAEMAFAWVERRSGRSRVVPRHAPRRLRGRCHASRHPRWRYPGQPKGWPNVTGSSEDGIVTEVLTDAFGDHVHVTQSEDGDGPRPNDRSSPSCGTRRRRDQARHWGAGPWALSLVPAFATPASRRSGHTWAGTGIGSARCSLRS